MTRAQNQIVAPEFEGLDRQGEQRQIVTISLLYPGQMLDETGPDRVTLDSRRDRPFDMQERVYIRLRVDPAELLENLLATPHAGEPVVYECDSHCTLPRRKRGLYPARVKSELGAEKPPDKRSVGFRSGQVVSRRADPSPRVRAISGFQQGPDVRSEGAAGCNNRRD
jgi:hypothetical protein